MVNAFRWMIFVIGLVVVIGSIMVTSAGSLAIAIYSPSDGDTVYTDTIAVFGGASTGTDGAIVESVTVNGVPSSGTTFWSADILLQEGPNRITVVATTDIGNTATETITVFYKAPTPTLTQTGSISINTTPYGAEVYLDDFFEGITPITLKDVPVGFHLIKVIKEGYRSETMNIRLGAGETKELNIQLKPLTGSINVSSTPSGASVYLDDVYTGNTTPCMLSEVAVGPHSIKLTKSDFFDVIMTVSVSAGETLHLHESLTGYGSLSISSDPSGAIVYLDGDYMGETPLNISKVVVGSYSIKLTKSGYTDVGEMIHVSAGKSTLVDETLSVQGAAVISKIAVLISTISVIIGVLILIEVIVSRRKRDALSKSNMKEEDVRLHVESRQKIEFAKRKEIIELNSQDGIKHKDYAKINPLYKKAQELEKRGEYKSSIETYKKIIDINEYYIKAWEGLERNYTVLGESEKRYSALMKTRSITEFIDFATNAAQKINLQQFELQNLDFFDNLFWSFQPQINILLGKNGYGKTYLLRLLISLLQKNKAISSEFFKDSKSNSFVRCNLERNNDAKVICRTKTVFEESMGKVPVLAIPDMRLLDKSRTKIEPIILDTEIRESGAYHFLYEKPFEEVIQNFLYELCIRYMDKGKSFEQPLFQLLRKVVRELTDKEFEFDEIVAIGSAKFEIKVITEGNPKKPLPLQKASQGTLSVLSIFGLIYYYLRSVFPDTPEEEVLKKPAIVFIDEVDAHLHPSWQQRIIGLLRENFPNVQFIVTAQSPLVVAGCYEYEVAVLRKGENGFTIEQFERDFIGYEAKDLYQIIFEIEEKDETYLQYTAQGPFKEEIELEITRLETINKKEALSKEDKRKLQKYYDVLRYIEQAQKKFDERTQTANLLIQNRRLKAEIEKLKEDLNMHKNN